MIGADTHKNLDSLWSLYILCNIFQSPSDTCSRYSALLWAGMFKVKTLVKESLSAPI